MERRRILDIAQLDPRLVFYAPLPQGDTTDHVSGNNVTINAAASLSWSSGDSAYLFNGSPGYNLRSTMFYWPVSLGLFNSSTTAANACYTITSKVKIKTANDLSLIRCYPIVGYYADASTYIFVFASRGAFFNAAIDNQWHTCTLRVSNGRSECFVDGVYAYNYATSISASNMSVTDANNYVSVFCIAATAMQGSACIKDIRVYNVALTNTEIASL